MKDMRTMQLLDEVKTFVAGLKEELLASSPDPSPGYEVLEVGDGYASPVDNGLDWDIAVTVARDWATGGGPGMAMIHELSGERRRWHVYPDGRLERAA